jgi:hypothetical protein
LVQNRLERGGRVFEPKSGLKSRALSKAGKSPTKINDTTEPILARPTLTNGIEKLMVDYFQCSHLAERLVPKMLSRVVGLSASGLLGLRPRSVLKTGLRLQNGPWRSSILGTNRQAAISTSTKRNAMKKRRTVS